MILVTKFLEDVWLEWFAKLEPTNELKENDHFRFDSVDITRAALVHIFDYAMKEVLEWCNANGTVPTSCGQFENCAEDLIELITDLDSALNCDENFMMGIHEV